MDSRFLCVRGWCKKSANCLCLKTNKTLYFDSSESPSTIIIIICITLYHIVNIK